MGLKDQKILRELPLITALVLSYVIEPVSWARGAKPKPIAQQPASSTCSGAGSNSNPLNLTTPKPVRLVVLPLIGTKSFQLPNGSLVNISFDMQSMLNTVVTSSNVLSPTDPGAQDPCNAHLELRSAVTNFQLDVVDAGINFGFSPSGSLSTITSMNGAAKVQVGAIAMDFSLWQCNGTNCYSVAASTSTHLVAGGNLTFTIDFSMVNTGSSLVFNPVLAAVMRTIMTDGMSQLVASSRFLELAWSGTVQAYNPSTGVAILSVGEQANLGPNQAFEIYAPTDTSATGVCDVWQTVAYVHTSQVNSVSSQAVVDQILDPRGIEKGDVVMVRKVSK